MITPADSRRILLLGANGQLAHELRRELSTLGPLHCAARAEIDLADLDALRRAVREIGPSTIVNAAAYTAVDRAETDEARCARINADAPGVLAEEAVRLDATLVHFSTDFVFDGARRTPYTEDDEPRPLNAYGRTKLAGERAILDTSVRAFVFRIGWVYDSFHTNFFTTMRRLATERDVLTVVSDQVGVPTWTGSVATAVGQLLALGGVGNAGHALLAERAGLYHMAGSGDESVSWAGFAAELLARRPIMGREHVRVAPITTADFPRPAMRPAWSVMSSARLREAFGITLPSWREQLALCLQTAPP